MEERLKALNGITYSEWSNLKMIVDDKFSSEMEKNTFSCDENVLDKMNRINHLRQILTAHK